MEVLLALAGIAGIAALLSQSKALPSQADAEKALDKLDKNPADPDANTVAGKYKAFVMGDYAAAMPYLAQGSDKTLKALAEHEMDAGYTLKPTDKVVMGDEWAAAAKKFPALTPILYDRASSWYIKAWPDLDGVWKGRLRVQGKKLAASRPPAPVRNGLPSGWVQNEGLAGRPATLDGNIAHTGSYSVKVPSADEKVAGSGSVFRSDILQVEAGDLIASAYILSDGTENAADKIYVMFFDLEGKQIGRISSFYPIDIPFWNRSAITGKVPATAVRAQFGVERYSKGGFVWVDDISVRVNGVDVVKNNSFEGR